VHKSVAPFIYCDDSIFSAFSCNDPDDADCASSGKAVFTLLTGGFDRAPADDRRREEKLAGRLRIIVDAADQAFDHQLRHLRQRRPD
jgi:hypothetical protein